MERKRAELERDTSRMERRREALESRGGVELGHERDLRLNEQIFADMNGLLFKPADRKCRQVFYLESVVV